MPTSGNPNAVVWEIAPIRAGGPAQLACAPGSPRTALLWDQHTCLPLRPDADISELTRYRRPGGALVSVNVGYAPQRLDDVLILLQLFRHAVQAHPDLVLAGPNGLAADKVAVTFDLEDCAPRHRPCGNQHRFFVRPA